MLYRSLAPFAKETLLFTPERPIVHDNIYIRIYMLWVTRPQHMNAVTCTISLCSSAPHCAARTPSRRIFMRRKAHVVVLVETKAEKRMF